VAGWVLGETSTPFVQRPTRPGRNNMFIIKATKALLAEYRVIKDVARSVYMYILHCCSNLNVAEHSPAARNNTGDTAPRPSRRFSFGGQSTPSVGRFRTKEKKKNNHKTPRLAAGPE